MAKRAADGNAKSADGFSGVKVKGEAPTPATEKSVDAAEKAVSATFPPGYREFVTTLGQGVYNGYVRVYPPERVAKEFKDVRARWKEYWFWDAGKDVLAKKKVLESVIVADTLDGDEVIFHPSDPGSLYVLPAESEEIHRAGSTLEEALDWLCTSGVLTETLKGRTFEPFDESALASDSDDDDEADDDDEDEDDDDPDTIDVMEGNDRAVEEGVRKKGSAKSFEVHGGKLTAASIRALAKLSKLREVSLTDVKLDEGAWEALATLGGVKNLSLTFMKVNDAQAGHIARMPALEELSIVDAKLGRVGLAAIGGMARLQNLQLPGASVKDADLAGLAGLKKLKALNLSGSKVTDAGALHFEGMKGLKFVWLPGSVSKKGVNALKKALPGAQVNVG